MKFCVTIPNMMHVAAMTQDWEHGLASDEIRIAMQLCDQLGYYKVNVGEHFVMTSEHFELSGKHYVHGSVALGVVAGWTSRLRLTSSVTILPLQNAIVQAKAWATLDWLSAGRAAPIFGVGWLEAEYAMLGVPFHERGAMADEYAAAIIELWTKDAPEFEGRYIKFRDIGFEPKPVQRPHLPIWFGGDAPAVLRRVAKFGDGWSPQLLHPDKFPEKLDYIRSQPEYDGRPLEVYFALLMLNVGGQHEILESPEAKGERNVQKIVDQCGLLERAGVSQTTVSAPPLGNFEEYLDWLRWVAEEIMPRVA